MLAGNEPTRNNMVTGERLTNRFALVSVIMFLKNKHAFIANTCQSNGQSRRLKFSTSLVSGGLTQKQERNKLPKIDSAYRRETVKLTLKTGAK